MSYILDALKRADAERERERAAVPGLNAQPWTATPKNATPSRAPLWLALAVALVVAAVGFWLWRTSTEAPRPAPAPAAAVAVPSASPAPVAQTAITPAAAPAIVQPVAPAPAAARPAATAATPAPVATSTKAEVAAPPPWLAELPEDLRRQLPALSISGAVYSDNPGQRLLLINSQVLPQGSVLAPDLTLEEIQPHSAVLRFRGTRFRVVH